MPAKKTTEGTVKRPGKQDAAADEVEFAEGPVDPTPGVGVLGKIAGSKKLIVSLVGSAFAVAIVFYPEIEGSRESVLLSLDLALTSFGVWFATNDDV